MNQRKRIISMALMLIVLFSMMAVSVYAATSYDTVDIYHYGGTQPSAKLTGSYADASCRNWAMSTGDIQMYVLGYINNAEVLLAYVSVSPGQEQSFTGLTKAGVTEVMLRLTPTTTTTRGEAVIFAYSD